MIKRTKILLQTYPPLLVQSEAKRKESTSKHTFVLRGIVAYNGYRNIFLYASLLFIIIIIITGNGFRRGHRLYQQFWLVYFLC